MRTFVRLVPFVPHGGRSVEGGDIHAERFAGFPKPLAYDFAEWARIRRTAAEMPRHLVPPIVDFAERLKRRDKLRRKLLRVVWLRRFGVPWETAAMPAV